MTLEGSCKWWKDLERLRMWENTWNQAIKDLIRKCKHKDYTQYFLIKNYNLPKILCILARDYGLRNITELRVQYFNKPATYQDYHHITFYLSHPNDHKTISIFFHGTHSY